jgi:integrase
MLDDWALTIKKVTTRNLYRGNLKRLLAAANMTPEYVIAQVKQEAKENDATTFAKLVEVSKQFKESMSYAAISGLRRFLRDKGVMFLPEITVPNPQRVKPVPYITWEQALKVCDAASKPYNLMFRLMLHCGWGTKEFLTFNTKETWDDISAYAMNPTNPDFYRYSFKGRKEKGRSTPFHTLIPMMIIREILQSGITLPFSRNVGLSPVTKKGEKRQSTQPKPFDMNTYFTSGRMMSAAFTTAMGRAAIGRVIGSPSKHDLRDAFRSRAAKVACAADAAEFAMGHRIDPLNYNKCMYEEDWLWGELKKIYGPAAATEAQVAEVRDSFTKEISVLQQQNKQQQATLVALLTENAMRRVKDRATTLKQLGVNDSFPPLYYTDCPVCRPQSLIVVQGETGRIERLRNAVEIHLLTHFDPEEAARRLNVDPSELGARSFEEMVKYPRAEDLKNEAEGRSRFMGVLGKMGFVVVERPAARNS